MSRFFIERPVVAMVIAILIAIAGLIAFRRLPVAQFPAHRPSHSSRHRCTLIDADAIRGLAGDAANAAKGSPSNQWDLTSWNSANHGQYSVRQSVARVTPRSDIEREGCQSTSRIR